MCTEDFAWVDYYDFLARHIPMDRFPPRGEIGPLKASIPARLQMWVEWHRFLDELGCAAPPPQPSTSERDWRREVT